MIFFNRILWKSGSTLKDLSSNLNDNLAGSEVIAYQSGDYLYLGSDYPFNHRHIEVKTPNSVTASVLSVEILNSNIWTPVVEVIDLTNLGGKTLSQSGILAWVPNRLYGWNYLSSTELGPDELKPVTLYDLYWVRVRFSASLSNTTELNYVGHRFCIDADIFARYPELSSLSLMDAYASGKTSWNDQCLLSSEEVIKDLINRSIITNQNQVLDWRIFLTPSIHKAAEVIYRGLGITYKDKADAAMAEYSKSLNLKIYNVDLNANARLDMPDKRDIVGWQTR